MARRLARWRRGAAVGAVLVLIASACVSVQVVSAPPASAAAPGPAPAGQWPFSEGSGTTTADSSGHGYTGTLGTGATWAAPEVGAHSIAANGTAAGAVTVTGAVVNTSSSYSVSAWVYMTGPLPTSSNETFVSINGLASPTGTTISGFYLQFLGASDKFAFVMAPSDSSAAGSTSATSTTLAAAGIWYHLAGVDNVSAGTLSLYVNGALQAAPAFTSSWQATGNTMIGQGMYNGVAADFVSGRIDDVAMYSAALTAAQVAALNQPVIATGLTTTCEISSGNASCWGDNSTGTLGDNSTVNSSVPAPVYTGGVLAGLTLTQIGVGSNFACALSSAGAAYCWGAGSSGQLGNNSTASSNVPVLVSGGLTFTQIDVGAIFACGLTSAGAAYCWGNDAYDQLGNTTLTTNAVVPTPVTGGLAFAQISLGTGFACGLTTAAIAYCWGQDNAGQIGNASATSPQTTPLAVTTTGALSGVTLTQISAALSGSTTCALSAAGAAYCWGLGSNGELGNGSTTAAQTTAVAVTATGVLAGVTLTQISGGQDQTCALSSAGADYCWGGNGSGDLGINSTTQSLVPVAVSKTGVLSGKILTGISASGNFISCAVDSFGAAYCWGLNSLGQAGKPGTAVNFLVPATVSPAQATTIAAGNIHSCEIDSGKAYCWGDNSNGELGNGSTMSSSVPVAVWTGGALSGVTLTQIATGTNFSCALSAGGAIYCWGLGTSGQLGDSSTASSSVPMAVYTGGSGLAAAQITANGASACSLSAGLAYCWGAGGSGQLGNGTTTAAQSTAVPVTTTGALAGVTLTEISAGGSTTCALASTGAAYCWGAGGSGQLGNGTTTATQSTAVAVTTSGALAGLTLTGITVGSNFACALSAAGAAYCWGAGGSGQLGNGTTTATQTTPVAVTTSGVLAGVTVTQLDAGSNSSCALSSAGPVFCWGGGGSGQLGNGTTTAAQSTAVAVTATGVLTGLNLTQIGVGTTFVCALSSTGADFCWGADSNGQDGNPAKAANALVPVAVMAQATMIAAGYSHTCLLRNGKAFCWGDNTYGELGNNTTTTTPVSTAVAVYTGGVLSGKTLIQISAGQDWTCALASTGAAYCWGNNSIAVSGDTIDLGNNTNTASSQAVLVSGALTFTQISVGADFACGLTSAGLAYCWGNNQYGQLGNGGTTASIVPGAVTATSGGVLYQLTLTQINAGSSDACALASAGAAYCWGLGTSGQLGNGASSSSSTAVAVAVSGVLSGVTLTEITTGGTSTCALASAGAAYCWGLGTSGQLGNGASSSSSTAVAVTATSTGMPLTQITAGTSFACAVDVTGAAYCWGLGTPGDQLGNNLNASSSTPVAVTITGVLAGVTLFQISSGQLATCTQDTTGAFYCWGTNTNGQLGNTSTTSSDVPVTVAGIVPGAPTSVAAFPASTTAAVYWAAPASLGTGALTGYIATATAASGTFTCTTPSALTCTIIGLTNGTTYTVTVVTQTADGNSPSSTAATVTPWPPEKAITAGGRESSCTIYTGKAYCWGTDTYGELGNGVTSSTAQLTPVAVYTGGVLAGITLTQITMGYWHVCALASTGAVYCWGYDVDGELGNGTTSSTPSNVPVLVSGGHTFTQISAGQYSTCGVSAGAAYCWGLGSTGQLGYGTACPCANSSTPQAVTTTGVLSGKTIVQIAAGYFHTCALDSTGTMYCWGDDTDGELGNNTTSSTATPAAVVVTVGSAGGIPTGATIIQITASSYFTCALASTGLAYCWGYNANGQLGINNATSQSEPEAVYTAGVLVGVTLVEINVGEFHACALGKTGAAYCWGFNSNDGRLGTNNLTNVSIPTAVYTGGALSGRSLSQIAAGDQDSCALDSTGTAYCWGADGNGQLGNDTTVNGSLSYYTAAVLVDPQAPTSVTAAPGDTIATVSWTAPVYLNNGTLTGYAVSSTPGTATCSTAAGTTTCGLTGLTNGTTYTVTVTDTTTTGTSAPSTAATVDPAGLLTLTSPASLTWALTNNGFNQSAVDTVAGDQQLTANDNTATGNGWHITVSATTFTTGTYTLPNAGAADFTGSITSPLASTAPTATCVSSCTLPTDTSVYPVAITTAPSAPTTYTVYDTAASTGKGAMTIGGSTAANPIGWWVQAPASTRAGTYTSTVTLGVVSGP